MSNASNQSAQSTSPQVAGVPDSKLDATVDFHTPNQITHPSDSLPISEFGNLIGGYRLTRLLGEGGMGAVYEAVDTSGKIVALKLIRSMSPSQAALTRFEQEGKLTSSIDSDRCVFVYEAKADRGIPYIVMEFVSGGSLQQLVQRDGPIPAAQAIPMTMDVLTGLESALRIGMIHRDINPKNCFVEDSRRLKLGDFGLARMIESDLDVTTAGTFAGTPLFASPEQLKGEELDTRTDLYGIAATLYYMLTGKAPHEYATGPVAIARAVTEPPPKPSTLNPKIDRQLEQVVMKGLEIDRNRRYRTPAEFKQALAKLLPKTYDLPTIWQRFGSWFVDYMIEWLFGVAIAFGLPLWMSYQFKWNWDQTEVMWIFPAVLFAFTFRFISLLLFKRTPGQWLFGLKVLDAKSNGDPSSIRIGMYLLAYLFFFGLWIEPFKYLFFLEGKWISFWLSLASIPLMLLTMVKARSHNAYRCLHEMLAGTKTMSESRTLASRKLQQFATKPLVGLPLPAEAPQRLDNFTITSVLRWDDQYKTLIGFDPNLNRTVLIELDADSASLSIERAKIDRPTRLRHLVNGTYQDRPWSAYLLPNAISFNDLLSRQNKLAWVHTHELLSELTNELRAQRDRGERLASEGIALDQLLVNSTGQPIVLDHPLSVDAVRLQPLPLIEAITRRCLDTPESSATSSAMTFEGAVSSEAIHAPLPPHVDKVVQSLAGNRPRPNDLDEVRQQLRSIKFLPTDVTTTQRIRATSFLAFTSAVVWLIFLALPIAAGFAILFADRTEYVLVNGLLLAEKKDLKDKLSTKFPADHPWRVNYEKVIDVLGQREEELRKASLEREKMLGIIAKLTISVQGSINDLQARHERFRVNLQTSKKSGTNPPTEVLSIDSGNMFDQHSFRIPRVEKYLRELTSGNIAGAQEAVNIRASGSKGLETYVLISAGLLAVAVLTSFVIGQPLHFRAEGLAIVSNRGGLARRWQIALRSFVFWLPFAVLSVIVYWAYTLDLPRGYIHTPLHLLAFALGIFAVATAIRSPRRGPHDWFAGTSVMPT